MNNYDRALRRALAAVCAFACLLSPEGVRADERETANTCVGFQNEVGEKLMLVHASNACEKRWACSLSYVVQCQDNEQKVTSRAEKRASFTLAAKGAHDLELSATHCKQGWSIDELAWSCN